MSPEQSRWRWRCQRCGAEQVEDRLLGMVADGTAVHRLTCESCGAVSHYDRKPGATAPLIQPTSRFRWLSGPETPSAGDGTADEEAQSG